jgi:hypothetical protein
MKNIIRKILKEEEDDGFNWVDSVSNSPNQIIRDAGERFKWETYIPILSKKIEFYINPEWWNLMVNIRIEDVADEGNGSFGDDPHKDYQPSVLNDLESEREQTYYSTEENLGDHESNRKIKYVNVEKVIDDIEGYSVEAKQYTDEYQQRIETLTREYMGKMSGLSDKYNFNDDYGAESVVVQPDGTIRRERDFPTSRYR